MYFRINNPKSRNTAMATAKLAKRLIANSAYEAREIQVASFCFDWGFLEDTLVLTLFTLLVVRLFVDFFERLVLVDVFLFVVFDINSPL